MKTLRLIVIVISVLIIIAFLLIFDYSDPFSRRNAMEIVGILAAVFNILAIIFSWPEKRNPR
jgi:multisubunit Na+/H+ antiporter MnhG subunit